MKRPFLLFGALCALLAPAFPVRAEDIRSTTFARALSFTASGYDGESTFANFPALVRLSEGIEGFRYEDIGATTNAAYAALRFADDAGNSLDYEIETWDPAGTSFVWVSLPSLSGTNTSFRAYYAPVAGAALPAVHPTNVWTSAGYVGVWHLNDIVKNYANAYKAYDDHLWGHVFPDSTGRGANATKGTTSWNTSLMNAPTASSSYHFPESYGRANGTLGANAYTPFLIPPTAEGGGAGDWSFSGTGYSTEAWVFPFAADHSIFIAGQDAGGTSANFIRAGTNLVRIAGNDWGGGGVGWNADGTGERTWHFVATVWTPAGSADPTVLYGTSGSGAPAPLLARTDKHATDQFATDGMRFTGGTGIEYGLDEMRVRRGLSTPDWIQASWDTQRVGTDFLEVGFVHDPRVPVLTSVANTAATAELDYSLAGGDYAGGTVRALFVSYPANATNAVAVANPARPSARATGLSPDTDYSVRFVVERGGAVVYETPETAFVTAGRPTIRPNHYRRTVAFTATGYDGAETLEHFPVLLHLSETAVPGFSYVGVDPATIRFTGSDGALLAHEVETWDPTGLSTVWVCLPSLAGTNTTFTMHWLPYDGAGVPAQPVHRVWHYAGYVGVWHLAARMAGNARRYEDSSGGGATLIGSWDFASSTNAAYNANGTPWSSDGARACTTNTAGWTFSRTGHSVEAWISTRERPGYNAEGNARNGYMFASEALVENGSERKWAPSNGLQIYPAYGSMVGGLTNATVVTPSPAWSGDATNDWHFISAVWNPEGSSLPATLYEAGAGYSSHGTNLRILRTINRRSIDFDGIRGMGVFASSDRQGNGCWYDEARVRRGVSTPDWIQANWDTQRVGTDFLAAGPIVDHLLPTILLIR